MGKFSGPIRENPQPDNFLAQKVGLGFGVTCCDAKQDEQAVLNLPDGFSCNRDLRLAHSLDNGSHTVVSSLGDR